MRKMSAVATSRSSRSRPASALLRSMPTLRLLRLRCSTKKLTPRAPGIEARGDQAAHRVAAHRVLDLDDVGAPVAEHGAGRRHEAPVGDLDQSDTVEDLHALLTPARPTGAISRGLRDDARVRIQSLPIDRPGSGEVSNKRVSGLELVGLGRGVVAHLAAVPDELLAFHALQHVGIGECWPSSGARRRGGRRRCRAPGCRRGRA